MRPKYLKLSTNCSFSPLTQNSGKEVIATLDRSRGGKTIHTDFRALSDKFIILLCCTTISSSRCSARHEGANKTTSSA